MKKQFILVLGTSALVALGLVRLGLPQKEGRGEKREESSLRNSPFQPVNARVEQPIPPERLIELDRMARKFVLSQRRKAGARRAPGTFTDVSSSLTITGEDDGPADPFARLALPLVGADPEAEAYWFDAINDPTLSADERQDLIEDLNEEGFADPEHPTIDDLPLIVNRLDIIEELALHAMDETNSEAFAEAHQDLTRMAELAEKAAELDEEE